VSILLDTNVLLAVMDGQKGKLPPEVREILESDAQFAVSVASLWEATIKWRLGKLPLPARPENLPELVDELGFDLMPITARHVTETVSPDPPTRDPFDRLLLAQCAVQGLRLLTTDAALVRHPLSATAD
jgi:PIN domain nuclease of toxin-antitoxin system